MDTLVWYAFVVLVTSKSFEDEYSTKKSEKMLNRKASLAYPQISSMTKFSGAENTCPLFDHVFLKKDYKGHNN